MSIGTVDKDLNLFTQGSFGDYFYILKEGDISLFINNKFIKNIKPGESFGELGMIILTI
jgi:CRP-like cAMP-binding protein